MVSLKIIAYTVARKCMIACLQVRKLEFLMAESLAGGHDSVITIGGIQSNHCRATSTAATYFGMQAHLILRNTERGASQDPGLVGNLLVERLQGAHIHQVLLRLRSTTPESDCISTSVLV